MTDKLSGLVILLKRLIKIEGHEPIFVKNVIMISTWYKTNYFQDLEEDPTVHHNKGRQHSDGFPRKWSVFLFVCFNTTPY